MKRRNEQTVRLGLIGCGRAANELHLPALRHVSEIKVAALADLDECRLQSTADRFGVAARYVDYRQLLDDAAIDAVAVCVPPRDHVALAITVLDAGKHLFIEKPLALSLTDCDRLVERAARSPRKTQVGFNLRQNVLIRRARRMIAQGELGQIDLMRSCFTAAARGGDEPSAWRNHRESGGGVLTEVATHHFDLWRFLSGSDVREVFVKSHSDQSDDLSATVTARMANGMSVSGLFSERTFGSNELEVFGQGGWLRLNLYRFDGFEHGSAVHHSGDLALRMRQLCRTVAALPKAVSAKLHGGDFLMTYQRQWRRFAAAILHGGPIDATLEDGRAAVAVASAAVDSAVTGAPVQVADNESAAPHGQQVA